MIVLDREHYLKETSKQLEDKEDYLEFPNDLSALLSTIFKSLEKIRKRGDLLPDTLNYFLVKDSKFARFYSLPKIHKQLFDVPERPVISNYGFYMENISSFLDFHLHQKVQSYIKDSTFYGTFRGKEFNPLSTNPTKWSNKNWSNTATCR